jgi:2,3-bisphosphoglycerate-independent phosphoglycerate mutase
MSTPTPHLLCILDGVGLGRPDEANAVHLARTPHLDRLFATAPWVALAAHGRAVGMPSDADMGNSEVGHNAMGAGRIIDQGAKLVEEALASGQLAAGAAWREVVAAARGGTLHLIGLLSDGNVHSHIDHTLQLLKLAAAAGVPRLRVHALTDGRDVEARSAPRFAAQLEAALADLRAAGVDAAVACGGGRMHITMDRYEADWAMVARGWATHVHGQGRRFDSLEQAIATLYAEDPAVDDQWLPAFVIGDHAGINDGDAVVLTNFRGDRAIELSVAFLAGPDFTAFDRGRCPQVTFAGMMQYDGDRALPPRFLVAPPVIDDTVGARLAAAGLRSLALSETQKFGHVTYFFNGNRSEPLAGEDRLELQSDNLPFNQAPRMQAAPITAAAIAALQAGGHPHMRLNLANGDMVGHTGDLAAAITALEEVDACVGALEAACRAAGVVLLITADHGNCEEMAQRDKKTGAPQRGPDGALVPSPSHSLNPVPLILVDPTGRWALADPPAGALWPTPTPVGSVARIGGTLLQLAGLPVPEGWLPGLLRQRA